MSAKTAIVLSLVLACLGLSPTADAAQGSIGPLQQFSSGHLVTSSARAGSLAYLVTVAPTSAYPVPAFIPDFLRSDGTPAGTFSIDPRGPYTSQEAVIRFADSLGDLIFFTTAKHSSREDRGLWRSNGTVAGTFSVTQGLSFGLDSGAAGAARSVPARNLLFFSAGPRSGSPDFELWATDGTLDGTRLVEEINPVGASNPRQMIERAGRLFFLADTPQGQEIWRSDGTPEGTEPILDLHAPGTAITLTQASGALFILADSESGLEVWRSDGTAAGTTRVLDLPLRLQLVQPAGRNLFLTARDADAQSNEMWVVDSGTGSAGRVLQSATPPGPQLLAAGNNLVFSLEDDHGQEPWWSDGTPAGTRRIADVCPGPCDSTPFFFGTYRGRPLFLATDGVSGHEPWLTDGTAAGTFRLGDFCPGECSASITSPQEVNGWLVLPMDDGSIWISDGTRNVAWRVDRLLDARTTPIVFPDWILFVSSEIRIPVGVLLFAKLPVTVPAPPAGDWLAAPRVPGFRFKVQIGAAAGRLESACTAQTLCVSGAVRGRSEVFLRVSGPQPPDGRRWPSLIKLTLSAVDVWVQQTATGSIRHYRLNGSDVSGSTLPGVLDREGFLPPPSGTPEAAAEDARAAKDPKPPGGWIESTMVPGFRVQARLTSNGTRRILRKEPCNIAETFCLSGATPGLTDLLVRVTGPKPNKHDWPMLARFTPATLEVWIQQKKTGAIRYYRLNAPPAGSPQLDGSFDRLGFKR